jgi:hypothetical protein
MIQSNNVYYEWTESNYHDSSEVINMAGTLHMHYLEH